MILANVGRSPLPLMLIGATSLLASVAHGSSCPVENPSVTITSPAAGYITTDATIDIRGNVRGVCALADLSCGTTAEAVSIRSRFVPGDDRVWTFECTGVELDLADAGSELLNTIDVLAYGFDANGASTPGAATIDVFHEGPSDAEPPPGPGGFPVNTAYTKSKVTWNHRDQSQDAFSTNARLGYPDDEPLPLPCASGDSLTVTLFASGDSQALYSDTITGDWNMCSDSRLRKTGPRGGIREISFDRRSDGQDTFYVYWERVEYGPSDFASVAAVDGYLLHITMLSAGQSAEWQVEIGPELSIEDISSGRGDEVRSVVRYHR